MGRAQDSHHMRILSHASEMLLAVQDDCFGRNHHVVGCTLRCLGSVYCCHLGEVWRGRDLLEKALCIQERVYGPGHRVVATILTNLGNAYGDLVIRKSSEIYWQRHCASKSVSMELNTEK